MDKNKVIRTFFKKNLFLIVLLIIALGAFLRFYHFSDWLHFELDQSRDAKVIDLAIQEGPGALPLLGPKAAGSFLRLGPIFYYFKYLSALVFGNTPSGIATIIMIFGILALPMFYLLVRRYFSKSIAVSLLAIFSFSLFLVMYSRFSWNPNPLPLFIILAIYSLLRSTDNEEKRKGFWILSAAFSLSVAIQLHFLAFVSVPVITVLYLAFKRPKIKLVYWIGAIGIVLVMNFPVVINDIKTGGENFNEFKKVLMGKSSKDSNRTLADKVIRSYKEHASGYFLILSAQNSDSLKIREKISSPVCDQSCKKELYLGLLALAILSAGIILLIKRIILERDNRKKDFLIIVALWFLASFVLLTPLAFDISPRYWLISSALPFVFVGFIFDFFKKLASQKIFLFLLLAGMLALLSSNFFKIYQRFEELRKAPTEAIKVSADRILKEKHRVTLEQQYLIIDYVENRYKKNNYPVYLNSEPFYRRSFLFHLDTREIAREDFRNAMNNKKVYQNGNYFLVYPTNSNLEKELDDYILSYDEIGRKQFGTLMVIELKPKPEKITDIQQEIERKGKSKNSPGVPERYTWEEIFSEDEEEGE